MSITAWIIEYITDLIRQLGYLGIYILMTFESSGIPIPSEVVVTFGGFLAARGIFDFHTIVIISTLANLTGSLIFYYVGYFYGEAFVHKYGRFFRIDMSHVDLVRKWFRRYGDLTIFIGRITPAIRTYISLPAGIGKMDLLRFSILTIIGSYIWNFILAYMGLLLGENWAIIIKYLDIVAIVIIAILIIAIVYLKKIGWKI